ncbi:hypothetical protein [Hoeflea marina]|uniref:hypothetical protein n=1 Tax=Hoeflea marina TaxID=274592 RepID=UPI000D717732|nr:hypothetical protein [Hoeflea marina]
MRKQLPTAVYRKLLPALALLTGIETVVVLKDIYQLDGNGAAEVTLWAAKTLLTGAMTQASMQS